MRLKITSLLTINILLFSLLFPLSIFADNEQGVYVTKDEVIYGKLHANGEIDEMYVVNSFYETTEGEIVDYGNYKNLRNLTDLSPIEQSDDEVTFQATGEDFYYQGELKNAQLPWDINITYLLDGVETPAEQLAGQSGDLEIRLETKANQAIDPIFFDYYLLQISLTFDPLYFQQITAPKGTEANEGKNKLINFSAMPGEEDIFIVTAKAENLTLDPINISAVPANLSFDDPDIGDMEDDMKKLSKAIQELHDGVVELYDGVVELDDGTSELNKGSSEYLKGMQTINQSSQDLIDGSKMIKDAFAEINEALDIDMAFDLEEIKNLEELPDILRTMSGELKEFSKTLKVLDDLLAELPSDKLNERDITKLYQALDKYGASNDIREIVNQLVATYTATETLFYLSENIPVDLTDVALEIAAYLAEIADELENNLGMLDELGQIPELIEGLQTMAKEYNQFHDGLIEYTNGINELTKAYEEIDGGIDELSSGTDALKSGVKELVDGTKELHEATSDLPDEMQAEIDEFMADFDFSDFEPKSFVSEKNKKIGVVQFVLQTETIEIPEDDIDEEVTEEKKGLWQKFLDLFR